jgi:hypothetical protein
MEGRLKANVDAGWDILSKKAGIGILICDHTGKPVVSEWKFIPLCASAEEEEMMACLAGLKHLIAQKLASQNKVLAVFENFFGIGPESVFNQHFPKYHLPLIRKPL